MQDKTALWLTTTTVSALAGLGAFYLKVKSAAIQLLDKQGAFDTIRAERTASLVNLYGAPALEHKKLDTEFPIKDRATVPAMREINKKWWTQKRDIVHRKGADTFQGALNMLPAKEKNKALGFAAVTSVVAGSITYMAARYGVEEILDGLADGGHHGGGFWDILGDLGHGF